MHRLQAFGIVKGAVTNHLHMYMLNHVDNFAVLRVDILTVHCKNVFLALGTV